MTWISIEKSPAPQLDRHSFSVAYKSVLSGGELLVSLAALINEAKGGEVLRIMSPVIDEPQVVSLLKSARKRGVVIRILTTLADRHGVKTKGWDASLNIESHDERIRELAKCGCSIRSSPSRPHGKFVLLGCGKLWFGSANLAVGALSGAAIEAGMVLNRVNISNQIKDVFDQIWSLSAYFMIHRQRAIYIDEKRVGELSLSKSSSSEEDAGVFCSAPREFSATRRINELLGTATREILLVSMSLYDLKEVPDMQQTLLSALRQGVRVRAVVRKEHFVSEEAKGLYPDPSTIELMDSGMELLGLPGLHAKGFLVDDRWCGIQSANFNPYSFDWRRDECNVEAFLVGRTNDPILIGYAEWLRHLCNTATHRMS